MLFSHQSTPCNIDHLFKVTTCYTEYFKMSTCRLKLLDQGFFFLTYNQNVLGIQHNTTLSLSNVLTLLVRRKSKNFFKCKMCQKNVQQTKSVKKNKKLFVLWIVFETTKPSRQTNGMCQVERQERMMGNQWACRPVWSSLLLEADQGFPRSVKTLPTFGSLKSIV